MGFVFAGAVAIALIVHSRSSGQATTQATLIITPPARQLLYQLRDAYAALKSLDVTGKIDARFDIDGVQHHNSGQFAGLYTSAGLFRSEMRETSDDKTATTQPASDAILGNTGQKLYFFLPERNRYLQSETPEGKLDLDALGSDMADVLRNQDFSLALALSGDAAGEIFQQASAITKADDQKIDGQSYPAITVFYPRYDLTLSIDPKTHLLRRATADLSKNARLQGAQTVKTAVLTMDYDTKPAATLSPTAFAWSPPPGAQLLAPDSGGSDIEGKTAPAFSLPGIDGRQITTQGFAGSVVVLDFWASWCGPCVASLPHLDGIYNDFKNKGVKFFAINLQEDKDTIQKFVADSKLSIPVLMDSDGKVAAQYDSEGGIPFTVVIGKDGKVLKAGFLGGDEDQIRPIIQSALK